MDADKIARITEAATANHKAMQTMQAMGALKVPQDPEEALQAQIRFSIAEAEAVETRRALGVAINS